MPAELPQCLSIIICDDIYRDEETKKLVIVGTFNMIAPRTIPWTHERMSVLFTLTNGLGEYQLKLAIEHAESGVEIAQFSGPMKLTDPLAITDFNVALRGLTFPVSGKYWVSLSADGMILMQRPFVVLPVEGTKEDQAQ